MSSQDDFMGRIRTNWQQRAAERTTFWAEVQIIPRWLIWLPLALYLLAVTVVISLGLFAPDELQISVGGPPAVKLLAMLGVVTAAGVGVTLIALFYGYIGADAKRRGMSPVLWVLVALLVPYLIGAILYFVVREPLPLTCPQCGRKVNPHFNFCPACQFNLRPNCPQCRRTISLEDHFCPHCGFTLQPEAPAQGEAQWT